MTRLISRRGRLAAGLTAALTCLALVGTPALVSAHDRGPSLRNGGFEAGSLAHWRTTERGNPDEGWAAQRGRVSRVSGFTIPAPPQGRWQAVADQSGPGSHVLYRDIRVKDDDLGLTMKVWYHNEAEIFFSPRSLNAFGVRPNQQLRIDLMRPDVSARSMVDDDILATVFRTVPGSPFRIRPRTLRVDLSEFEDETVRLRVAEVDNLFFFQAGVDAVRLVEIDDDDRRSWPRATGARLASGKTATAAVVARGDRYGR